MHVYRQFLGDSTGESKSGSLEAALGSRQWCRAGWAVAAISLLAILSLAASDFASLAEARGPGPGSGARRARRRPRWSFLVPPWPGFRLPCAPSVLGAI